MHQVYDDEMTFKLVAAASTVSGLPVEVCLEEFGKHFLVYCQKNGYDQILRVLGSNLYDFLTNLDNLHDHLASIYPGMRAPSFRVTRYLNTNKQQRRPSLQLQQQQQTYSTLLGNLNLDNNYSNSMLIGDEFHKQNASCSLAGSMYLHYYSDRAGLSPIVKGLVMAVAREFFQTEIQVTVINSSSSSEHERTNESDTENDSSDHVVLKIDRKPALDNISPKPEVAPAPVPAAAPPPSAPSASSRGPAGLEEMKVVGEEDEEEAAEGEINNNNRQISSSQQQQQQEQEQEQSLDRSQSNKVWCSSSTKQQQQKSLKKNEKMLNIYDSLSTNAMDSLVNSEIMMQTFPFHVIFDRQFNLVQVGKSLLRVTSLYWQQRASACEQQMDIIKNDCLVKFSDLFEIMRPKIDFTFDAIADHTNQVFVVRTKQSVLNSDFKHQQTKRASSGSSGSGSCSSQSNSTSHCDSNRFSSKQQHYRPPVCPMDRLALAKRRSSLNNNNTNTDNNENNETQPASIVEFSQQRQSIAVPEADQNEANESVKGQQRQHSIDNNHFEEDNPSSNNISLRLKGQMIILLGGEFCLFLCSPRVDHLDQLVECGVRMSDFALHDRARELMLMSHTHKEDREAVKKLDQASNDLKKMDTKLRQENKRTNEVLHNIFPAKIASLLSHGMKVESESFDLVTCLYSDIIGFTKMCGSENVKPIDIVRLLNTLYLQFDNLTTIHNVFKVETIGDAYVVVGGLPEPAEDHADRCVKMGLDMVKVIATVRSPADNQPIQMRIGIHSGPVMAGIVGIRVPRYSLFGNTTTLANQLETHGVGGKIHISDFTLKNLIKRDRFVIEDNPAEIGVIPFVTYFVTNYLGDQNETLKHEKILEEQLIKDFELMGSELELVDDSQYQQQLYDCCLATNSATPLGARAGAGSGSEAGAAAGRLLETNKTTPSEEILKMSLNASALDSPLLGNSKSCSKTTGGNWPARANNIDKEQEQEERERQTSESDNNNNGSGKPTKLMNTSVDSNNTASTSCLQSNSSNKPRVSRPLAESILQNEASDYEPLILMDVEAERLGDTLGFPAKADDNDWKQKLLKQISTHLSYTIILDAMEQLAMGAESNKEMLERNTHAKRRAGEIHNDNIEGAVFASKGVVAKEGTNNSLAFLELRQRTSSKQQGELSFEMLLREPDAGVTSAQPEASAARAKEKNELEEKNVFRFKIMLAGGEHSMAPSGDDCIERKPNNTSLEAQSSESPPPPPSQQDTCKRAQHYYRREENNEQSEKFLHWLALQLNGKILNFDKSSDMKLTQIGDNSDEKKEAGWRQEKFRSEEEGKNNLEKIEMIGSELGKGLLCQECHNRAASTPSMELKRSNEQIVGEKRSLPLKNHQDEISSTYGHRRRSSIEHLLAEMRLERQRMEEQLNELRSVKSGASDRNNFNINNNKMLLKTLSHSSEEEANNNQAKIGASNKGKAAFSGTHLHACPVGQGVLSSKMQRMKRMDTLKRRKLKKNTDQSNELKGSSLQQCQCNKTSSSINEHGGEETKIGGTGASIREELEEEEDADEDEFIESDEDTVYIEIDPSSLEWPKVGDARESFDHRQPMTRLSTRNAHNNNNNHNNNKKYRNITPKGSQALREQEVVVINVENKSDSSPEYDDSNKFKSSQQETNNVQDQQHRRKSYQNFKTSLANLLNDVSNQVGNSKRRLNLNSIPNLFSASASFLSPIKQRHTATKQASEVASRRPMGAPESTPSGSREQRERGEVEQTSCRKESGSRSQSNTSSSLRNSLKSMTLGRSGHSHNNNNNQNEPSSSGNCSCLKSSDSIQSFDLTNKTRS